MPDEIIIDEQRVKQVLINLIQNALKFTFQGFIQVVLAFELYPTILKFTVKDTGIGIRPEDKDKLFKLFGKIETTASINTSGIGLGLSICMKIVEAFGGYIFLERDQPFQIGSAFTFTIPIQNLNNTDMRNDRILNH